MIDDDKQPTTDDDLQRKWLLKMMRAAKCTSESICNVVHAVSNLSDKVLAILSTVINYDVLYIGGGNARLITLSLPDNVRLVPNKAGITGGVRLWYKRWGNVFAGSSSFAATPPEQAR
jgi:hypothetical protein